MCVGTLSRDAGDLTCLHGWYYSTLDMFSIKAVDDVRPCRRGDSIKCSDQDDVQGRFKVEVEIDIPPFRRTKGACDRSLHTWLDFQGDLNDVIIAQTKPNRDMLV